MKTQGWIIFAAAAGFVVGAVGVYSWHAKQAYHYEAETDKLRATIRAQAETARQVQDESASVIGSLQNDLQKYQTATKKLERELTATQHRASDLYREKYQIEQELKKERANNQQLKARLMTK